MSPIFKNLTLDMEFSYKRKFFALFLGINSDKFHYNSISSKRAVIFCSIKSSVIWILTGHKIYNMKIHKVLKNGPKIKSIPSFERGDHAKSKYIMKNKF